MEKSDQTTGNQIRKPEQSMTGDMIPGVIERAFRLNPELKISVIYKGTECFLLYTGGKICIKPSKLHTIWLEGELWNKVSITEQEYQKVEDVILQNEIGDAAEATREEPGFDFLEEKETLSENDRAVKKLFTETVWPLKLQIGYQVTVESVHLICSGIKQSGDDWEKKILEGIPLKNEFRMEQWREINITNAEVLGQIADYWVEKLKNHVEVDFIQNRLQRPVILKIACKENELHLLVAIGR